MYVDSNSFSNLSCHLLAFWDFFSFISTRFESMNPKCTWPVCGKQNAELINYLMEQELLRISDPICSPVIAAEHKLRANASFIIIGAIKIVSVNFKRNYCEQNHDHIFISKCRVVQMQLQTKLMWEHNTRNRTIS